MLFPIIFVILHCAEIFLQNITIFHKKKVDKRAKV